jgi:hypothetical protein
MARAPAPTLIPAAAGGALAAGAAAAVLLGPASPLILIAGVVAAVAGGVATAGMRRDPGPPRLVLPAAPTSAELLAAVDEVEAQIEGKVPPAVSARVRRICAIVRDTIPRLDQLGAGSAQAHSVVATATSYLPEAVGAYLRLPRAWADKRPVSGGKTSLMVLCDQLDLLAHRMDQVFDAVCRADADALVAHGAFLREKFGAGSLDVSGLTGLRGPNAESGPDAP